MTARTFDLTIPAGDTLVIAHAGEFVTCLRATLPTFLVGFDRNPDAEFGPGLTYRPAQPFRSLHVRNPESVPNTVKLTLGAGEFIDARQVSSAPDSFEPGTLAGLRELGYRAIVGATSAGSNFCQLQIWNPSGSGVLGVIRSCAIRTTTAGTVKIRAATAALSTALANPSTAPIYLGDAAGALLGYKETALTSLTGTDAENLAVLSLQADTTYSVPLVLPLIIPAGAGVNVLHETAAVTMTCTAELLELPG